MKPSVSSLALHWSIMLWLGRGSRCRKLFQMLTCSIKSKVETYTLKFSMQSRQPHLCQLVARHNNLPSSYQLPFFILFFIMLFFLISLLPLSQVLFSKLFTSWTYNMSALLCRVFLGRLEKQAFLFVYNKSHLTKIFISRIAVPYKPISTQGKALSIIPFSIQIGNSEVGLCQRYQPPAVRSLSL